METDPISALTSHVNTVLASSTIYLTSFTYTQVLQYFHSEIDLFDRRLEAFL